MKEILKWTVAIMVFVFVLGMLGRVFGFFNEAAQVAQEQFGPRALLQKYEWFKDAAANLDSMNANIRVYEQRRKALVETYKDTPRAQWPRDDRQEWNLIETEVAGVKAAYNNLAADYNAQMAKFNYRFTNAGMLPEGADRVLPREYRSYEVQ